MKNKNIAWILAIFLGGFWVQRFYLWKYISGVLCVFFFWTYIPMIYWIIEGIYLFSISKERFKKEYKVETDVPCPYCLEPIRDGAKKCKHCWETF